MRKPARNRQRYLAFGQQIELINALAFSEIRKPRLNTAMTIVWRHSSDFEQSDWVSRERDLWKKIRGWLERHGVEHRCIWVRENGQQKGPHLHAFLYIPNGLRGEFADFLVRSEKLGGGGLDLKRSWTGNQHRGFLRYLMKTADPSDTHYEHGRYVNVSDTLGIRHNGNPPLPVSVKRYGVTENLGPRVRKTSGFADAETAMEARSLLGDIANAGLKAPPIPAVAPLRVTATKAKTALLRHRARAPATLSRAAVTHLGDDSGRYRQSFAS